MTSFTPLYRIVSHSANVEIQINDSIESDEIIEKSTDLKIETPIDLEPIIQFLQAISAASIGE